MYNQYPIEEYTDPDVNLFVEFNRIKKFVVTDHRKLRAKLYLNLRDTTALNNMLCCMIQLHGRPEMGKYRDLGLVYTKGLEYQSHRREFRPFLADHFFVNTLMYSNMCLEYNSKTVNFAERLKKASRFHQYCIISGFPYNYDIYLRYKDDLDWRRHEDKLMDDCYETVVNRY